MAFGSTAKGCGGLPLCRFRLELLAFASFYRVVESITDDVKNKWITDANLSSSLLLSFDLAAAVTNTLTAFLFVVRCSCNRYQFLRTIATACPRGLIMLVVP